MYDVKTKNCINMRYHILPNMSASHKYKNSYTLYFTSNEAEKKKKR